MNEYDRWAEEYKKSAELTKEKINELEQKRKRCRSNSMKVFYGRKLLTLYQMYGDCMISYRELKRKAEKTRRGTEWTT